MCFYMPHKYALSCGILLKIIGYIYIVSMYALLFINGDSDNVQVFWLILLITLYMYCVHKVKYIVIINDLIK